MCWNVIRNHKPKIGNDMLPPLEKSVVTEQKRVGTTDTDGSKNTFVF